MNALACPYGSRSWRIPSEQDDSDALETLFGDVLADAGWMDTESADVAARIIDNGEALTLKARAGQNVLRDLISGFTLEEASSRAFAFDQRTSTVSVRAAVECIQTLIQLGQELERQITREAESRLEARREAA